MSNNIKFNTKFIFGNFNRFINIVVFDMVAKNNPAEISAIALNINTHK